MGNADDYSRNKPMQQNTSAKLKLKLKLFLLLFLTNSVSIFLFSPSGISFRTMLWGPRSSLRLGTRDPSESLIRELNRTQSDLAAAAALLETLLTRGGESRADGASPREPAEELGLAVGPHRLPLGYTPSLGSDQLYPALGAACRQFHDELVRYMSYEVGGECPSDDALAQRLLLKGCEPLPRRRCHPKSPRNYVEPAALPTSLWSIPPDSSVTWDAYTCKSYSCLVNRNRGQKGNFDCKDCFDLSGREKDRWVREYGDLDYSIDRVLRTRPPGTVRIGLDIGGGTGTFAARMREHGVTVVTTTMNFDGPFNGFVAARGLVPIYISVAHRLPFYDNTLDIVHSMHVLSNWIPEVVLEFMLYDVYRVLRPGGLFWLDRFFCEGPQMNATYVPMLDRTGFRPVLWNVGRKLDRGAAKNEWYLSALLEKPMT